MNDDSTRRQITWDDDGIEQASHTRVKKAIAIVVAIIVALVSAVPLANYEMSPSSHTTEIQALDKKAETVTGLVTVATATSAAITLLPGDVGTPIAEKLADVSSDFLIVLATIYLEKYLLSILGLTAFRVLVPAACAFFITWVIVRKPWRRMLLSIALRLFLFGVVIAMVVPVSIVVSNMIESTYASDVDAMVAEATMSDDTEGSSSADAIPSTPSDTTAEAGSAVASTDTTATTTTDTTVTEGTEDRNIVNEFVDWVTNLATDASSAATAAGSNLTSGVSDTIEIAKKALNNLIESLAVMIVINCVIPILVLIFFVWFANLIFGTAIRMPELLVSRGGSNASAHMSGR